MGSHLGHLGYIMCLMCHFSLILTIPKLNFGPCKKNLPNKLFYSHNSSFVGEESSDMYIMYDVLGQKFRQLIQPPLGSTA